MFKAGKSGNPEGMLPVGDNIKNARKLTRHEFESLAHKYMTMTRADMKIAAGSENCPAIDLMIIAVMLEGFKGDWKALSFILDRTIGMAVRKHTVVIEDDRAPAGIPVAMTTRERLNMMKAYSKKLEGELRAEHRDGTDVIDVTPDPEE